MAELKSQNTVDQYSSIIFNVVYLLQVKYFLISFSLLSLVTVNELAAGDQNQSAVMELNEGEISNASAFIDPNETQLPTGILKFPTIEVIDVINKEIDNSLNR